MNQGPKGEGDKPMISLNHLIVRAQRAGQHTAELAHHADMGLASTKDDAHHLGGDIGHLALIAYRTFGLEEAKAIMRGYQAGYNARASELGDFVVRWIDLKNGISRTLPGATEEESRN